MCVSNGAPTKPGEQTPRQKGIAELWRLLRAHNAVFYGDPELDVELRAFLRKNKIKRGDTTAEQKKYTEDIKKMVESSVVVESD